MKLRIRVRAKGDILSFPAGALPQTPEYFKKEEGQTDLSTSLSFA